MHKCVGAVGVLDFFAVSYRLPAMHDRARKVCTCERVFGRLGSDSDGLVPHHVPSARTVCVCVRACVCVCVCVCLYT